MNAVSAAWAWRRPISEVSYSANVADTVVMQHLVWLDIETSGLHPTSCYILEIASVLTTADTLEEITRFEHVATLSVDVESVRSAADPVVQAMHDVNGLWASIGYDPAYGPTTLPERWAEWCQRHVPERTYLAGRSVHFDRNFIATDLSLSGKDFPSVFSHRHLDLTSLQIAFGWPKLRPKSDTHRAMADVREDIEWYRAFRAKYVQPVA